jgi:AraC-like DNA-binding protein
MTNFFFVAIFILFYLILTFKLLSQKIWFRKNLLLNTEHFDLIKNWTIYFFIINALCGLLLLVSLHKEFNNGISVSGKSMAIFMLLFWLFLFFKILISPEILYGLPILNRTLLKFNDPLPKKKEAVSITSTNWVLATTSDKSNQDKRLQENIRVNIESYIREVDTLSAEKLIFRNPKTSQSNIAEILGVPVSHVVYLFKYHSKISFSEYRMNSRIQDAVALIKDGFLNTETLESLAYKTGFSSYNPFFIAFKKITTFSPQEYPKKKNT